VLCAAVLFNDSKHRSHKIKEGRRPLADISLEGEGSREPLDWKLRPSSAPVCSPPFPFLQQIPSSHHSLQYFPPLLHFLRRGAKTYVGLRSLLFIHPGLWVLQLGVSQAARLPCGAAWAPRRRLVSGRGGRPFIDRSVHVVGRGRVLQRGLAAGGVRRRAAGGRGGVASRRGRAEQARPGHLLAVVPVAGGEAQVRTVLLCLFPVCRVFCSGFRPRFAL
jgi:hypothetical protein